MLRTVIRRPSPAAVFALLVLVVIAAPLADAAQNAVKSPDARAAADKKKSKKVERARFADKAKFADNAGKVRGYSVGFAALPSRVVLTGPNGKFPKDVIPAGTQGPQGPPGPRARRLRPHDARVRSRRARVRPGSPSSQRRALPVRGSQAAVTRLTSRFAPARRVARQRNGA